MYIAVFAYLKANVSSKAVSIRSGKFCERLIVVFKLITYTIFVAAYTHVHFVVGSDDLRQTY